MMPKIWTLKLDIAVKQSLALDLRPALIFNGDKERGLLTPTSVQPAADHYQLSNRGLRYLETGNNIISSQQNITKNGL